MNKFEFLNKQMNSSEGWSSIIAESQLCQQMNAHGTTNT